MNSPCNVCRTATRVWLAIALSITIGQASVAQVEVFAGGNYCSIRNDVLQGEQILYSWHAGGGVELSPFHNKKLSIKINLFTSQKGYTQFDGAYTFKFQYISAQTRMCYHPLPFLSVEGGIDLGVFVWSTAKKGWSTYNPFDAGLVGGLSFFDNKRIGFYSRLVYGLVPMLDYPNIDPQGNFKGNIHDLKNTCLMIGLKFNIYNRSIP